jgi:hypothetical protein
VNNCALAVSTITHQPEQEVEAFLLSIVDVNQLATQMQYWMTDEYIPDLLSNKIKDGVYHPQVRVTVNIMAFRSGTFNEKTGCAIDGIHPDLGPVNGQEPLKKANELFYWMVNSVFQHYHQMRLTLQDVASLSKTQDVAEAEKLRAQAFRHLPEKSYHALQAALCSELLVQQKTLSENLKERIATERQDHKRKHAALTIGGFWRDQSSKRQCKKAAIALSDATAAPKPM